MPERSRLVIQFVSVRNAAGRQVLNELKGLAIRLPQIELHHGFWSDEHLHEALAASSVFYMNYDAEAYAHKTSGLLWRSEAHTSELQSLMRISYAVFCLKKKNKSGLQ